MAIYKLEVEGMSCSHCVNNITSNVSEINGVKSVEVSLEKGNVHVEFDENKSDIKAIAEAIEDLGFDVLNQEQQ